MSTALQPAVPETDRRPPRILVVDDERSMRELLAIVLRREGYEVLLADNGRSAVELLGRESALGKESFKVEVRSRDGQVRTMYLDARSYLVTRIEETRQIEGKGEEFETLLGDYRTVAGLVFPHVIEVGPKRGNDRQKLIFDKIEVNVPMDDARFAAPAAVVR